MKKVTSVRGKNKIMYKGYVYVKQKNLSAGVISYECEKRRGNGTGITECKAKMKVKNDEVVGFLHDHTHAADEARVEVLTTRANIKRRAQETEEAPQQILGQEMENLSQAASIQMVPLRFVRRTVRRVRQAIVAPRPIPADRATLELPEEYRTLANGEIFLLFDSGVGDDNRILVFGMEHSCCSVILQAQH